MANNDNTTQTRRKKKLILASTLLLVICLVIAANIYISSLDYSVDLSEDQIYTLSKTSRDLLAGIDRDVTIYVMGTKQECDPVYCKIFGEYEAASDHVSLSYCPRDRWDQITKDHGVMETNIEKDSILLVSGELSQFISSADYVTYDYSDSHSYEASELILERLVTEALRQVMSPEKAVIYFLQGQGEREPGSILTNVLEEKNYQVAFLDLSDQTQVPEDCSVLVINGPVRDLDGLGLRKIKNYMDKGGKIYLFLDPSIEKQASMDRLLALYGLKMQKGVVVEKNPDYFSRYEIYLIPDIQDTEITAGLKKNGNRIILPAARGITTVLEEEGTTAGQDYKLILYLASSREAYAKVDLESSNTDKEKNDIGGPFALSLGVKDQTGGRLIVTGCANMLEESVNRASGGANLDFVVNGLEYLSHREGSLTVPGKELARDIGLVPAFDQKMILAVLVVLLPAVLLGAGIVLVIRRKRQ